MRSFDTDWLANISIKWVLVAVGLLLILRMSMAPSRPSVRRATDSAAEFMESALIAIVLVFLVIRPFIVQAFYIPSGSMIPTLQIGDRILVNKFIYRVSKPGHGDVVVFVAPNQASPDEKDFIKRIVGLPGDRISVIPTRVLIDGKVVARFTTDGGSFSSYGGFRSNPPQEQSIRLDQRKELPALQPGGEVWVRRNLSEDDTLRIIPVQQRDVRVQDSTVYLNGQLFQSFGSDPVSEVVDLSNYGGDPSLVGTVILVNDQPQLMFVVGRKLSVDAGHVERNGRPLREGYIAEPPAYAMGQTIVPTGKFWVMGDNRNDSNDSHAWGPLDADRVIGRAEAIFWPIPRIQLIRGQ